MLRSRSNHLMGYNKFGSAPGLRKYGQSVGGAGRNGYDVRWQWDLR